MTDPTSPEWTEADQQASEPDHERIWLQNPEEGDLQFEGRTWCQDRIDDTDTEYVRADLFAELETKLAERYKEEREMLEWASRVCQDADETDVPEDMFRVPQRWVFELDESLEPFRKRANAARAEEENEDD